MERCFNCKKPVLGFVGKDELLDTVYLTRNDDDLTQKKVYGECHSSCLVNSPWATRWANLRVQSLVDVRGFELLETENARICYDKHGYSVFLNLVSSQRCISLEVDALDLSAFRSGYFIVEHRVCWDLGSYRREISPRLKTLLKEP